MKVYQCHRCSVAVQHEYCVCVRALLSCRKYKVRRWFSQINEAFRKVSNMPDYGRSISWPEPPPVLKVCEKMRREKGGRREALREGRGRKVA